MYLYTESTCNHLTSVPMQGYNSFQKQDDVFGGFFPPAQCLQKDPSLSGLFPSCKCELQGQTLTLNLNPPPRAVQATALVRPCLRQLAAGKVTAGRFGAQTCVSTQFLTLFTRFNKKSKVAPKFSFRTAFFIFFAELEKKCGWSLFTRLSCILTRLHLYYCSHCSCTLLTKVMQRPHIRFSDPQKSFCQDFTLSNMTFATV